MKRKTIETKFNIHSSSIDELSFDVCHGLFDRLADGEIVKCIAVVEFKITDGKYKNSIIKLAILENQTVTVLSSACPLSVAAIDACARASKFIKSLGLKDS
jgi:hypothetical protein